MLLATHGRAIWILDHLAPIQEYAAAQATSADAKLFTPPASVWYQRPARDRNYEFWGDQTFFGENPPQAAVLSWLNRKQVGDVKLKITDAAGREVREISSPVLANSTKPGLQSACWDLRVQPVPTLTVGQPAGGDERQGLAGVRPGGSGVAQQAVSPFGAGCGGGSGGAAAFGGGGGAAAFGSGGGSNPGPLVLPGVYEVALIVDGKTIETKPVRVLADPEVVLTEGERKRLYNMAMELHSLQGRANDVAVSIVPLTRQMPEVMKQVAASTSLPGDIKAQAESFHKELSALSTKLVPQGGGGRGGGGGGRGGTDPSPIGKAATAKNVLMGGMLPTQATLAAYADAKTGVPAAIAEANALLRKAHALSATLATHNITLSVAAPKPGTMQ